MVVPDDIACYAYRKGLFAIAQSGEDVVILKTQADIDERLERLEKFKRLMPRYRNLKALGAVAGMVVPEDMARYVYRQGLFAIAQSGENVIILNDPQLQPKAW
jgi:hypothetical protein